MLVFFSVLDIEQRLSVRGRAATETSEKDDSESEDDDDDDDDDDDGEQSAGSFTSIAPADHGIVCVSEHFFFFCKFFPVIFL